MSYSSAPRTRRVAALAFIAACAGSACGGDPAGSGPPASTVRTVAVGEAVSGSISRTGQVDTVRIVAAVTQEGGLYLQATSGSVQATLVDLATGQVLATLSAAATQPERGSEPFTVRSGITYQALVSAASSAGGSYRVRVAAVGDGPEQAPAQLTPGDTVAGERLESATDVDDFSFTGTLGESYIVFAQALGPATGGLRVRPIDPGLRVSAGTVTSRGGDAELERQSSGTFALTASGTVHVIVSAPDTGEAYRGDYRLLVRRVNFAPESRPVALVPGDTMTGEAIDYVGDVDLFTLSGAPGQPFNLFIQGEPGSVRGAIWVEASEPGRLNPHSAGSDGTRPLLAEPTGTFVLPASGTVDVRVSGASDRDVHRGRYRLFVYPVAPRPEHVPATLALGDSVVAEPIDLPGDVDEFTFTLAQPTLVGMTIALPARQDREAVFAAIDGRFVTSSVTSSTVPVANSGQLALLPAGEHTVRVSSWTNGVGLLGTYRVRPYAIDTRPEHVAAALAVGDTVTGEDVWPSGDRDDYTFQATAGQVLSLFIQASASGASDQLLAWVFDPDDGSTAHVFAPFDGAPLGNRAARIVAAKTGSYRVQVYPAEFGRRFGEQGAYTLALLSTPQAPEHVAANLAMGDSVVGERLDVAADADVYFVSGTPGAQARIALHYAGDSRFVNLRAEDRANGQFLGWVTTGPEFQSPIFTIPASGLIKLTVSELCPPAGCMAKEAYTFSIR